MDSKTKKRIVLTLVSIPFLILIGYLLYLSSIDYIYEWTVEALIIGSFAFFDTFTFTKNNVLFVTLLTFGIFVLPFVIKESGILDNYTDEPPDADVEGGHTIEEAEESFDRFAGFLKSRFDPINKIKNYALPIGITLAILGGCLITLPSIFLIDSEPIFTPETEEWLLKDYGFIRGQLLLIGVTFLIIVLTLNIRFLYAWVTRRRC